jgi:hypothetical protein
MYKKGDRFTLKNDVTVGKEIFLKDTTIEIYNIVEDSIFPYNILFIQKSVVHMAFPDNFIQENCIPITN